MQITRDVVRDLLPLYLSDEVSPDSRALVEAFLEQDPELARLATSASEPTLSEPALPALAETTEMQSLRRVRRRLTLQSWVLGFGIFFALSILSFRFSSEEGIHWFVASSPAAVAVSAGLALTSFCLYAWLRRSPS